MKVVHGNRLSDGLEALRSLTGICALELSGNPLGEVPVEIRGLSVTDADARLASKVSDEDRLRLADVVIDTAGDLAHTHAQVDDLWESLPAMIAKVRS